MCSLQSSGCGSSGKIAFFSGMQDRQSLKHLHGSETFSELLVNLIKLVYFNENKWFASVTKSMNRIITHEHLWYSPPFRHLLMV